MNTYNTVWVWSELAESLDTQNAASIAYVVHSGDICQGRSDLNMLIINKSMHNLF